MPGRRERRRRKLMRGREAAAPGRELADLPVYAAVVAELGPPPSPKGTTWGVPSPSNASTKQGIQVNG